MKVIRIENNYPKCPLGYAIKEEEINGNNQKSRSTIMEIINTVQTYITV
jgi:hypothetical protein